VKPKPYLLPPVRPNAGTEALYRRKLRALVRAMNDQVTADVLAAYKANAAEIEAVPVKHDLAVDELPSATLKRIIAELSRRWGKRFGDAAPLLASYFAKAANRRSAKVLEGILRDGGFSVKFKMTDAARDAMNASISEQVGLIKSIPEQYFLQVQGDVMRSVSLGRDLAGLTKDLQKNYGVTYRRAAFIARDQNAKATATITKVRHLELGITTAIWLHSHGGKVPRPTHLANSGKKYNIVDGWLDPAINKRIWPGTEINCRCVSKPIVEGFS
jgi:SPP1 gp7 family putative phage head morphogenesis protein